MMSSIYGITVTVLVMYLFLGTSVTFCKLRKNFAHVFGKRNDGFLQDSSANIYDKQTSDPLLDKIRLYQQLAESRHGDDMMKDSFYNDDGELLMPTPTAVESYDNVRKDSLTLLDIMSPMEKDFLSYLYDIDADNDRSERFPKYI